MIPFVPAAETTPIEWEVAKYVLAAGVFPACAAVWKFVQRRVEAADKEPDQAVNRVEGIQESAAERIRRIQEETERKQREERDAADRRAMESEAALRARYDAVITGIKTDARERLIELDARHRAEIERLESRHAERVEEMRDEREEWREMAQGVQELAFASAEVKDTLQAVAESVTKGLLQNDAVLVRVHDRLNRSGKASMSASPPPERSAKTASMTQEFVEIVKEKGRAADTASLRSARAELLECMDRRSCRGFSVDPARIRSFAENNPEDLP